MMRKVFIFLLSFCILLPLFSSTVFAQGQKETSEKKEVTVILPQNTITNHDYFAAGNLVDIEGTVNGDVYIAGATVLVNGVVNGDVLAGGGQVTIKGSVHNVRVGGGQVLIEGKVSGNVTALGGNVIIGSGAQIAGSLVGAGGQYTVLAPIGKTMHLAAGQVTISSLVNGDVTAFTAGQITLTPTARVNGNLWYQSPMTAQIESGATIVGSLTHILPPQPKVDEQKVAATQAATDAVRGMIAGISIVGFAYMVLFGFLVGLMLLGIVPIYTHRAVSTITRKPWLSLGVGLLGWLVTPLAIILLALSIIGLPFIIPVIFIIVILTYLGKILFAVFLGKWIEDRFGWKTHQLISFLIGLVVFELLAVIPIVGWLFACLATAVGLGSVLLLKKEYYHQLRSKSII